MSLEKQEVIVTGVIPYGDVLEKIKKTGKEVRGSAGCVTSVLTIQIGDLWGGCCLEYSGSGSSLNEFKTHETLTRAMRLDGGYRSETEKKSQRSPNPYGSNFKNMHSHV